MDKTKTKQELIDYLVEDFKETYPDIDIATMVTLRARLRGFEITELELLAEQARLQKSEVSSD